jgi:hypothetical protein
MDINIINNDQTGLSPYPDVVFNEIRNNPYLNSPQDYYMSVVRFQLQTSHLLPTYIPQMQIGELFNRNKTIYSFTMSGIDGSGVRQNFQQYISWTPESVLYQNPSLLPPLPITAESNTSPYYYGYSIEHFVNLMNSALFNCEAGLAGLGVTIASGKTPFFILDQGTKRLSLVTDGAFINSPVSLELYCNSPLWNLIGSFPALYYGTDVQFGKNYRFVVENYNGTNLYYVPNTSLDLSNNQPRFKGLQMFQEWTTIDLWNAVDRIVFTTGLLPVSPSLSTQPVIFNSNQQLLQSGNNSMVVPLITDMQDQTQEKGNVAYKPVIAYIPTAEYRLLDLYGNNPLSALQISILWADKFGNYYPLKLASGCNASLKIMFRKKTYQSSE